jgi:DNA (cytosine-5)-methyltransferase 1
MGLNSYISLFSGAGGLDLGLEKAGWNCRYASDIDPAAVETLDFNKKRTIERSRFLRDAFIEKADIRKSSGIEILSKTGIRRGDIALLAGGPPCQSWSSAGHQNGFQDPRGQLFSDFIRLAGELDARWLLFENVRGLLTARGSDGNPGSALQSIRRRLLSAGYQTTVSLLNAADYGIPQRRVRLFVLGYRYGDAPLFPFPSHAREAGASKLKEWMSMRKSLASISSVSIGETIRPSGRMALELAELAPGTGIKSRGKVESTRPGGHWGYKQGAFVADLDLPARTVTASAQQDWIQDTKLGLRRLCPRECANLQSFPTDWVFAGNAATQYRLIGNAVPPNLAAAVGQSLLCHNFEKNRAAENFVLHDLLPLPSNLAAAIHYTAKEEARNGASRKAAPYKRISRLPLVGDKAI